MGIWEERKQIFTQKQQKHTRQSIQMKQITPTSCVKNEGVLAELLKCFNYPGTRSAHQTRAEALVDIYGIL